MWLQINANKQMDQQHLKVWEKHQNHVTDWNIHLTIWHRFYRAIAVTPNMLATIIPTSGLASTYIYSMYIGHGYIDFQQRNRNILSSFASGGEQEVVCQCEESLLHVNYDDVFLIMGCFVHNHGRASTEIWQFILGLKILFNLKPPHQQSLYNHITEWPLIRVGLIRTLTKANQKEYQTNPFGVYIHNHLDKWVSNNSIWCLFW